MQTKFPQYVVPVQSNDEYSYEPTHCSFEVRHSIVLKIARYLALTWLFEHIAKPCSEVRFHFPDISWMTINEEDNLLDEEIVDNGGFADEDQIALSFNASEDGLRGYEIQPFSEGYFRLLCYHKHSGVEFFSNEIEWWKLFSALRFKHVWLEIEHLALLHNARKILRRLSLPQH